MTKILFNLRGEQHLVEVGQGGGVTSEAEVIWDERQDGPLANEAPVGYAEKFQGGLRENSEMKAAKEQRDADKATKEASDSQDLAAFKALVTKVKSETATAAEVRRAFKFLLQKLGQ